MHFTSDKQEKEQSITQLNVSNSCYVLDQKCNYMFRPLEAIFRLHKIDLEENEYNIYSKRNGVLILPRTEAVFVCGRAQWT